MHLPNALWRRISPVKVFDYLLNRDHVDGASKAAFFESCGFVGSDRDLLLSALFDHPARNEVERVVPNPFGTKYVVRCTLQTPGGRDPCIRSVWIIEADGLPRLVTAYPA
jgi:hypothetical protein